MLIKFPEKNSFDDIYFWCPPYLNRLKTVEYSINRNLSSFELCSCQEGTPRELTSESVSSFMDYYIDYYGIFSF